jgi:hypothetical protein
VAKPQPNQFTAEENQTPYSPFAQHRRKQNQHQSNHKGHKGNTKENQNQNCGDAEARRGEQTETLGPKRRQKFVQKAKKFEVVFCRHFTF